MIFDCAIQANAFLSSLWNAIVNWWAMEDHNPLGAIYQAMLDGGVITGPVGGPYQLANPNSVNSSFGDLTTEQAWQAIEASAKNLWLTSIKSALDPAAQAAINALSNSFLTTASNAQPLTPPTLTQISPGNPANANPNLANSNLNPNLNPNLGGAHNPTSAPR